jgi:ribosomal protein S18 acetylase RimI-like enzyme
MAITVVPASAPELEAASAQLLEVYRATFALPPFNEQEADFQRFAASLASHVARPGFRACLAKAADSDQVVGFAYGYTSQPGQWWHDRVTAGLADSLVAKWFAHAFEVVIFAVLPALQGQGIGGRLHDCLLAGAPHGTALLSAFQDETPAWRLYRRRGWQTVREAFVFPGGAREFVVLGLNLQGEGLQADQNNVDSGR